MLIYQKKRPPKLYSLHMYQNFIKKFHPFFYCLEMKTASSSNIINGLIANSGLINIKMKEKFFTKIKIHSKNNDDSTEIIEFEETEKSYKQIILNEAKRIIELLETENNSSINSIRFIYLITGLVYIS